MVQLRVALLLLMARAGAAAGPAARCFECKDLPLPSFCTYTTVCATGHQCMVNQVITTSGMVLYNSGCQSSLRCKLAEGRRDVSGDVTLSKRNDIIVCSECCEGDYCNNQGCGILAMQRPNRGPYCFQCDYAAAPDHCRTISTCDTGEVCMLTKLQNPKGTSLYRSSCKSYGACGTGGLMLVGRKRDTSCHTCCSDDFCNDKCTALTSSTVISSTPTTSLATDTPTQTLTLTSTKHSVTSFNLTSNTIMFRGSEPVTSITTSSVSNITATTQPSTATPSNSTATQSVSTDSSSTGTATSPVSSTMPSASKATSPANTATSPIITTTPSSSTATSPASLITSSASTATPSAMTTTSSTRTATSSASKDTSSASHATSSATPVKSATYTPTTEPVTTRSPTTTTNPSTTPIHNDHFKDVCHHRHYHYDSSSQLCYRIHQTHRTWADADHFCRQEGGRLAVVDTQAKWAFLVQHVLPNWYQNIYIGGRDIDHTDTYYWTNGARLQFNNWAGDQPDGGHENCMYLSYKDHWAWHDTSCPNHMAFLCTIEKQ